MSQMLKCPNPSCPYVFDPSLVPAGVVLSCPRCGMQFTLGPPAAPPEASAAPAAPATPPSPDAGPRNEPRRESRERERNRDREPIEQPSGKSRLPMYLFAG